MEEERASLMMLKARAWSNGGGRYSIGAINLSIATMRINIPTHTVIINAMILTSLSNLNTPRF